MHTKDLPAERQRDENRSVKRAVCFFTERFLCVKKRGKSKEEEK